MHTNLLCFIDLSEQVVSPTVYLCSVLSIQHHFKLFALGVILCDFEFYIQDIVKRS